MSYQKTKLCKERELKEKAERERDEWAALAGQYKSERDEARAWAETLQRNACQHSIRAENAERERDDARAQVENQKARIGEFFSALEKLTAERDEAKKILSGIFRWIERRHQDGFLHSLTYEQNLDRGFDALYDRLDDAEQQRHLAVVRAEYYLERYEQLKNEREAAK